MSADRRNLTLLPLVMLLALTLTGCAGNADESGEERRAPSTTSTPTPSATPTVVAAPATVAPIAVEPENSTAERDGQIQYSAYIETYLADEGYTLTPEEVLGIGLYACDLIAQGQSVETMTVIEGAPEHINEYVAVTAGYYLCPTD